MLETLKLLTSLNKRTYNVSLFDNNKNTNGILYGFRKQIPCKMFIIIIFEMDDISSNTTVFW